MYNENEQSFHDIDHFDQIGDLNDQRGPTEHKMSLTSNEILDQVISASGQQRKESLSSMPMKPLMVEQETQTESTEVPSQAMSCQTEEVPTRVGITQTARVEFNDEDCQTEAVLSIAQEIQVSIEAPKSEMGTDCPVELINEFEKELGERVREDFERKQLQKRLQIQVQGPLKDAGSPRGTQESDGLIERKPPANMPKTAKNSGPKINLANDMVQQSPGLMSTNSFSLREQSQIDYLLNRDPMQEFFSLTCQSIKLNSAHMNTICTIDTEQLYRKAVKMNVPYYKWQNWIEDFLNKEFLRAAL